MKNKKQPVKEFNPRMLHVRVFLFSAEALLPYIQLKKTR